MKIYFLRHGETEGNITGTFCGVSETPLSNKGKEQGVLAKEKLKGVHLDQVLVSPLSRAIDTAKLAGCQNLEIVDGLKEMDFGIFEGLTYKEIEAKHPESVKQWREEKSDYLFPQGESLKSFYDRVLQVYKKILVDYEGNDLLLVAHSGVLRAIFAHEISENFDHYWKYKVDNASLSMISYTKDGICLEMFNL